MVVDGPQVRELLLGPDGVAQGAAAGLLCVDCTTIGQAPALEIGAALARYKGSAAYAAVVVRLSVDDETAGIALDEIFIASGVSLAIQAAIQPNDQTRRQ